MAKKNKWIWQLLITIFFITLFLILIFKVLPDLKRGNDLIQQNKLEEELLDKQVTASLHYYFGCVESCMEFKELESGNKDFNYLCALPCHKLATDYGYEWAYDMNSSEYIEWQLNKSLEEKDK